MVSEATDKDCATWRVLKGEPVCSDDELAPVAVAELDEGLSEPVENPAPPPMVVQDEPEESVTETAVVEAAVEDAVIAEPTDTDIGTPVLAADTTAPEAEVVVAQLAEFETAAGAIGTLVSDDSRPVLPVPAKTRESQNPVKKVRMNDVVAIGEPDLVSQILTAFVIPPRKPEPAAELTVIEPEIADGGDAQLDAAAPGLYFVIGSFADLDNAQSVQARYRHLGSAIVSAELDGRSLYRVTVGPFAKTDMRATRRKLTRAGIFDAWAIRLDASDWVVAKASDHQNDLAELRR